MIHFEIINDLKDAENVWRLLSYNQTLFDTWEFRNCFAKYYNFEPYFILGKDDSGECIGLLPLQFNSEKGYLEFFGGSWMEDNKIYLKPGFEQFAKEFYEKIDKPAHLIGINGTDEFSKSLPIDDYKYQLDISYYKNYLDFIADKFNSKTQATFRRKFRKIEEELPMEFLLNQEQDIEMLFDYNMKTFGEDSSFNVPFRKEIYRDILKLPFKIHMLSIRSNGIVQAVSLNVEYNGILYYLNAGSNNMEIPNLGSYTIMKSIEIGINNNLKIFDALMINYNWKERWHFAKIPFNKFDYLL